MTRLLLVAGDSSGDRVAADFVRAYRARDPEARFSGMAGPRMCEAGVRQVVSAEALAIGGFSAPLAAGTSLFRVWRAMARALDAERPDLVVLIDSGGFNIPFAAHVRRRSSARILYYVAPQVWAWRRGRIRRLAARVDRIALILPFEEAAYEGAAVRTDYVGHPLLDQIEALPGDFDRPSARQSLGIPESVKLVTLLPGSRRNEVDRHLGLQLAAARWIHARESDVVFRVAVAPSLDPQSLRDAVAKAALPRSLDLECVDDRSLELLRAADVALLKPGTATLEAALLGCPMVVMGRIGRISAALLRRIIRLPHLSMPNLLLGEAVVPELLQRDAEPERLGQAVLGLLSGPERERQLENLERVREHLGRPGAAGRAAAIAGELLGLAAA
jgi:lipid-A-disaccharide synthase